MRIAYITHYADLYGANRSLLDLVLELRARGEVAPAVLLPTPGPLADRLAAEGIDHAIVPWSPWMTERYYMGGPHHKLGQYLRHERDARQRARANRLAETAVLEQLRAWRPDLVHANSAAVAMVPAVIAHMDVPLIWHIRELPEAQYLLHIDAGRRAYGRYLRKANRLIAISAAVKADIQRYAGPVEMDVILNGVLRKADYVDLASRSDVRWQDVNEPFTFLLAGVIHPSKGQEDAIRSLALVKQRVPNVRLVLAGGGKATHLQRLASELGIADQVEFRGFVPDMRPLFQYAHAFLMCSRNEAMGRVTVEAMGSGLPVIGHASGGTPELIEGHGGLLYSKGPEELAAHMIRLASDRSFARTLGQQLMRSSAERFNVERYASEVLTVYHAVLSRPAR